MKKLAIAASVLGLTVLPAIPAQAAGPVVPHTVVTAVSASGRLADSCMSAEVRFGVDAEVSRGKTYMGGMTEFDILVTDACAADGSTRLIWLNPTATVLPTVAKDLSTGSWGEAFPDYTTSRWAYDPATGTYVEVKTPEPFTLSGTWVATGPVTKSSTIDRQFSKFSRVTTESRPADADVVLSIEGHDLKGTLPGYLARNTWLAL